MNLDTSGAVPFPRNDPEYGAGAWRWSALSPFQQGYVEAAFASLSPRGYRYETGSSAPEYRPWSFSDLSSETFSAMLADCERFQSEPAVRWLNTEAAGCAWWNDRQRGTWAHHGFPPVTIALGDDGKIHQRDAS